MYPRKYNRAISIFRTTSAPDGYGGYTNTDALLFSGWANIASKSASYKNEAGVTDNLSTYVFTIRNRYDIEVSNKTDFIKFGGEIYNIDSVLNVDLNNLEVVINASRRY